MIEDEELDKIARQRAEAKKEEEVKAKSEVVTETTEKEGSAAIAVTTVPATDLKSEKAEPKTFAEHLDEANVRILQQASVQDKTFVEKMTDNLTEAAVVHAEAEKETAELKKQGVKYEREKLSTKQQKNEHEAAEDKWANKEKQREFHYNGVKPIMEFVGILKPLNLILLYFLTLLVIPFYLLSRIWKGTIGAIIAGAEDTDRPKAVKGFLWTLLGLIATCVIAALVYLFLKWQQII